MMNSSYPPGGLPIGGYPVRLGSSNISIHNRAPVGFRTLPQSTGFFGRTTIQPGRRMHGDSSGGQLASLFGTRVT
jgi:hypothetical protein